MQLNPTYQLRKPEASRTYMIPHKTEAGDVFIFSFTDDVHSEMIELLKKYWNDPELNFKDSDFREVARRISGRHIHKTS